MHDKEPFKQFSDLYSNLHGHVEVISWGNVIHFSTFSNISPNVQPQLTFIYYISIIENESRLGLIVRTDIKKSTEIGLITP